MVVVLDLGAYAIAMVCLGLALIITYLVVALLGWVAHALNSISFGLIGDGWVDTVEQACTNAFGVAFGWVDKEMGASLHAFTRFMDWLWTELVHAATGYLLLVELVARLVYAHSGLKTLVHDATRLSHAIVAKVHALEREWHGIERRVKTLEQDWTKGIGHDLRVGLQQTEKELARVENDVIPAIQAAEADAESAISNLYEWAKGKASLVGVGTFSVAVAAALDVLGLAALKCTNFKNLLGKFGCGLGTLLNDLLGLVVAGLVLESVCEFLPLVEEAFGAIADPMVHLLNEVPLGDCETVPGSWAALSVQRGPLPPPQTLGQLAA